MPWRLGDRTSAALVRWYLGPDHTSKLRLWRYLLVALQQPRLTVPYGERGRITLDYRDWLQDSILRTGSYEPEVWNSISAHADQKEVLWDVGAHIGSISILACQDPRFELVHSFEPHPRTFGILTSHLRLNSDVAVAKSVAHQLALGARCEERALTFGPAINSGMATLGSEDGSGRQRTTVHCRTVDSLVYESGVAAPTLMKIDVEDWELEVLRGAQRLMEQAPPKAIAFESAANARCEMLDVALSGFFSEHDYTIRHIPRPDGDIQPRENYLAVRVRDADG